jgi:ATP-dependent DNA helicase Rep
VPTKLNPQQKQAVEHIHGPLLVLAGAGSGKTGVIAHKIAQLISRQGHTASQIAAVTFTNKAAREMRSRVASLLPANKLEGLAVSTFHSLGLRILQRECRALGYKPGFSIFDSDDSRKLLKSLHVDAKDKDFLDRAQATISRLKGDMLDPEVAIARAESDGETALARLYGEYQRHLKAYNAVDFDDLLRLPVKLFTEHADVRLRWQSLFRYWLVDEYQDTNATQYELLRQLVGPEPRFTVVGDDDQSIYAWRGARPENIGQLQADYPSLAVIKLEQNYRSCGHILNAANHLIRGNPRMFEKKLWSALGAGDHLRILPCPDTEAEAERVVSELVSHRIRVGKASGAQWAILYRSNHQARAFERVLRERDIPYRLSGGQSFFDKAEVRDVLAYLRLLVNPDDDTAFLRVINTPRRELGPTTLEKLGEYAQSRHKSLFVAAQEIGALDRLPERSARALEQFTTWCEGLARVAESESPAVVARTLLQDSDYLEWLRTSEKDRRAGEKRAANVLELVEWLERMGSDAGGNKDLADVVAHLGLLDMIERRDESTDAGSQVQLMTLHAAKGLEFDHVFLVGVEENLLPHRSSIEEDSIEEERRLLYVGITRARRSLTLSFAASRKARGQAMPCQPSRFLQELPLDEIHWEGGDPARTKPIDPRESNRAHLAGLRQLLGES